MKKITFTLFLIVGLICFNNLADARYVKGFKSKSRVVKSRILKPRIMTLSALEEPCDLGYILDEESDTCIELVGDFDHDGDIDIIDFAMLAKVYGVKGDSPADIGPFTGTPPYIIPEPDGVVDELDLKAFREMWRWYRRIKDK